MQAQLPSIEELRARMRLVHARPLNRNTFYRDCPVSSYCVYGTGPLFGLNRGARYSPPQSFPVLYFSADRLQAQLEAAHHLNRHLPPDPSDYIRRLHSALTSYQVELLHGILKDMAASEDGYQPSAAIAEYLEVPIVNELFEEDPARLQVFLELAPHLTTPLRCVLDSSRLSLSVNVTARSVLDLNNAETLKLLEIRHEDLVRTSEEWETATSSNYTLTQRIGLAAWDAPGHGDSEAVTRGNTKPQSLIN